MRLLYVKTMMSFQFRKCEILWGAEVWSVAEHLKCGMMQGISSVERCGDSQGISSVA